MKCAEMDSFDRSKIKIGDIFFQSVDVGHIGCNQLAPTNLAAAFVHIDKNCRGDILHKQCTVAVTDNMRIEWDRKNGGFRGLLGIEKSGIVQIIEHMTAVQGYTDAGEIKR